jgi:cytochrome c-type biogenesis protein CcmH
MLIFMLLAGALTTAAVVLIAVPLIRHGAAKPAPASGAAIAAALVIVIGAALCYVLSSNWTWHVVEGNQPQDMVARLARRLEHNPNDLQGWLMLGQSYEVLQQLPLAVRAYERADRLAGGKNVDALVGIAGALALIDPAELDGRAGRLIEQAIKMQPDSGKALFYGAAAALRRGELPLARERFAHLLTLNPPANVRPILQQEIDAIDKALAAGSGASAAPAAAPQSGAAASVRLTVKLAPAIGARAGASDPLFVIVRDPKRPGPPLAVKRLESHFPQRVDLSAADSMLSNRQITAGETVEVIARIAHSGQATGASGDPFGEISYLVGQGGLADVVIDRLMP